MTQDHHRFKELAASQLDSLRRAMAPHEFVKSEMYRQFSSEEFFAKCYPTAASRSEYLERLETAKKDLAILEAELNETLLPLFRAPACNRNAA
jgi:hypothetical protein